LLRDYLPFDTFLLYEILFKRTKGDLIKIENSFVSIFKSPKQKIKALIKSQECSGSALRGSQIEGLILKIIK
jgi:hypothetical protein